MKPPFDYPKLSIWITSVGRIDVLTETIESWIKHCTYPYHMIIVHSQMTDVSKQFFALEYIDEKVTEEYLNSLKEKYPDVDIEIIIQPYQLLGEVYNQLLSKSGEYYLNLEDDLHTVCDPHDQIVDAITLLENTANLLGVRCDLRDSTWEPFCQREWNCVPAVGFNGGQKYIYLDMCSGGAQIMNTSKVYDIGAFNVNHLPEDYGLPERLQNAMMFLFNYHCAINLQHWGFLKHMGHHGIRGGDRTWTNLIYNDLEKYGWYGDGTKRVPMPHPRDWYVQQRVNNGKL